MNRRRLALPSLALALASLADGAVKNVVPVHSKEVAYLIEKAAKAAD
jgi:hypothetical protein